MKKLTVGIIGCGTIGQELALRIKKKYSSHLRIAFIADQNHVQAEKLKKRLSAKLRITSIGNVIRESDFIIEAASSAVSHRVACSALRKNKRVLIMSVGGLTRNFKAILKGAQKSKGMIMLPSGALCGIDGVLAACAGGIKKATLVTRKPIKGLMGAPYFSKKKIDLNRIKKETIVFKGSAQEAIKYFPKNVNVAALLSLASIGVQRTSVTIITSPHFKQNSHSVHVDGAFGRIYTRTENVPAPTNPKTSYLAILAAEASIGKMLSSLKIGT